MTRRVTDQNSALALIANGTCVLSAGPERTTTSSSVRPRKGTQRRVTDNAFIAIEDHYAPFTARQQIADRRTMLCASRRLPRKKRTALSAKRTLGGKGSSLVAEGGSGPRSLHDMLCEARHQSLLVKQNVNLFRRRSSDFFDDFDQRTMNLEEETLSDVFVAEGEIEAPTITEPDASQRDPAMQGEPFPESVVMLTSDREADDELATKSHNRIGSVDLFDFGSSQPVDAPQTKSSAPGSPSSESIITLLSDSEGDDDLIPKSLRRIGSIDLYEEDFDSLSPTGWLTGSVINAFLHLLNSMETAPTHSRTFSFSTYFYPKYRRMGIDGVRRWCAKVDVVNQDILLFPIHVQGSHWSLIVARLKAREILYYDSLEISGVGALKTVEKFLVEWLQICGWNLNPRPDCWKQRNAYDCGVHLCRTAYLLTVGQTSAIYVDSSKDTKRFRQKIKRCLESGNIR